MYQLLFRKIGFINKAGLKTGDNIRMFIKLIKNSNLLTNPKQLRIKYSMKKIKKRFRNPERSSGE